MNEIRPHGRELLARARQERTPDASDRERVLAALLAGLTAPGTEVPSSPPLAGPWRSSLRWLLLVALAALVAGAVYVASHGGASPKPLSAGAAP